MAYFPDLSPCTYFGPKLIPPLLSVGWLEPDYEYTHGDPGPEVYARLKEFEQGLWQPVTFCGGQHCALCRYGGFYSCRNLFIPGHGVTYASPEAIVHYVGCHRYLPPFEFCEALLASPPIDSPQYFASLQVNGWPPAAATLLVELPDERLQRQAVSILRARGDAIIAAIEAYRESMAVFLPRLKTPLRC